MKRVLIVLIILLMAAPCFATTYYIDYNSGDDNNDGLTKTTPWKLAPGMDQVSGVADSVDPAPGDRFIFKGGVTWYVDWFTEYQNEMWASDGDTGTSTAWHLHGQGAVDNRIYWGVDKTWYDGTSWSTPVIKPLDPPMIALKGHTTTVKYNAKITAIQKGNPTILTVPNHECSSGFGRTSCLWVEGMTELNKVVIPSYTIIDENTISIDVDSTNWGDFVVGQGEARWGDLTICTLLRIDGNDNWTFEGIEFRDINLIGQTVGNRMLQVVGGNENITFKDCRFIPNGSYAVVHGAGISNELFDGCYFRDAIGFAEYTFQAPGIHNLEYKRCIFDGFKEMNINGQHADGVQFHDTADTGDVTNLLFHDNMMTGDWGSVDGTSSSFNSWLYLNNRHQVVTGPILVYNNIIDMTATSPNLYKPNAIFVFDNSDWGATKNLQIFNNSFNIWFDNPESYMISIIRLRSHPESNYYFYNNIFKCPKQNAVYGFQDIPYDNPDDKQGMNVHIDYNTYDLQTDSLATMTGADPCGMTKTWDCWTNLVVRSTGEAYSFDQHSTFQQDINWDDDYTPQPPSPAIDTGMVPQVALAHDIYGNPRPVNGLYDLGAVENQGGSPPQPPTNGVDLFTYNGGLIRYGGPLIGEPR